MMWMLSFLDNQTLHMIAEVLTIVIGSVLLGILLGYLYWGEFKKKSIKLGKNLDLERDQAIQLKEQLSDLEAIKDHLQSEMATEKSKYNSQSKSLFDHQQKLYDYEKQIKQLKETIGELTTKADHYESRLEIIGKELISQKKPEAPAARIPAISPTRANYDHVSQLLGKPVTENDLTVIAGIGPRIASLLESRGIETWEQLSDTPIETLQGILLEAGGMYRSIDPLHWSRQASMAARSEWRKLRVYQQSLKNGE